MGADSPSLKPHNCTEKSRPAGLESVERAGAAPPISVITASQYCLHSSRGLILHKLSYPIRLWRTLDFEDSSLCMKVKTDCKKTYHGVLTVTLVAQIHVSFSWNKSSSSWVYRIITSHQSSFTPGHGFDHLLQLWQQWYTVCGVMFPPGCWWISSSRLQPTFSHLPLVVS